jgi:hypothetical protein
MRRLFTFMVVLAVAGCGQKLDKEKSFSVDPRGNHAVWIEGPSGDQKISAEAKSSGADIDFFLVLSETPEGSLQVVDKQQFDKILRRATGQAQYQFDETIPAGRGFAVVVSNPGFQKTDVTVKIKGQ